MLEMLKSDLWKIQTFKLIVRLAAYIRNMISVQRNLAWKLDLH